jgi:hypothetical protein
MFYHRGAGFLGIWEFSAFCWRVSFSAAPWSLRFNTLGSLWSGVEVIPLDPLPLEYSRSKQETEELNVLVGVVT